MARLKITEEVIEKYDRLNSLELRSDIENDYLFDCYIEAEGLTCSEPKTWSLVLTFENGDVTDNYHYDSETEYNEDLQNLGLTN